LNFGRRQLVQAQRQLVQEFEQHMELKKQNAPFNLQGCNGVGEGVGVGGRKLGG